MTHISEIDGEQHDHDDCYNVEHGPAGCSCVCHATQEWPTDEDGDPVQGPEARLEALRAAIEAESTSYGEIAELQSLAAYIDPSDVQLLEWAGVPEFADEDGLDLNTLDDGQVEAYNKRNADPILTCDICGNREWSGDLTPDWNGETGNHQSCEQNEAVRYAEDKWDREASR